MIIGPRQFITEVIKDGILWDMYIRNIVQLVSFEIPLLKREISAFISW